MVRNQENEKVFSTLTGCLIVASDHGGFSLRVSLSPHAIRDVITLPTTAAAVERAVRN
jgi:hypothetical protein